MPIDLSREASVSTPQGFAPFLKDKTIKVLPLVAGRSRQYPPGWATYSDGFDAMPDVEYFCGGINDKTPTAAALWRQGNLLHFGFQQSPAEMNETGQALLLDAIAYISHFTENRPIALTPSVFAGPTACPRTYLDRRLGQNGDVTDAAWILSARTVSRLRNLSRLEVKRWYAANRAFLHPGPDAKLELDEDAKRLGAPIDRLEFFTKAIATLRVSDQAPLVARLLARYAPAVAGHVNTASRWEHWFGENRPYLFFSDEGDYRWYVDLLAKKRGVPSRELRGPARASVPWIKPPGNTAAASASAGNRD